MRKFSAVVAGANAVRSASTSSGIEITRSPIVYSVPYSVYNSMGKFEETMLPGVVSKILGRCDCRFLLNHSRDLIPLARTTSGTLRLSDSPDALRFSATLDPRQSLANDLAVAIERGDITQMSCSFVVEADSWNDTFSKRTISEFAELLDVSAVTYPASPTTSIDLAPNAPAYCHPDQRLRPDARPRVPPALDGSEGSRPHAPIRRGLRHIRPASQLR